MYKVAIVGATGAVGTEMIKILEERKFPISELSLYASSRSAGRTVEFEGDGIMVQELNKKNFSSFDLVLFSAGEKVSLEWAPIAQKEGAVVIDNSKAFRMREDVPLVVPEVNGEDIKWHKGIIANPNCSTIQLVVVIKPLHDRRKIERVVISTYQSVSGTGLRAMVELREQTFSVLQEKEIKTEVYPHPIAFNCFPHIGKFCPDGYTEEEHKLMEETKKIMHDEELSITATTVRVPVFVGHCESVNLEFEDSITPEEAKSVLEQAEGVEVVDEPEHALYPSPFDVAHKDKVYVGRIREDPSIPYGLNLWIVADNLRKGAALNAVQIAEQLVNWRLL
jgi:aspartate-semialdehyde dehydrogenase